MELQAETDEAGRSTEWTVSADQSAGRKIGGGGFCHTPPMVSLRCFLPFWPDHHSDRSFFVSL
jgi:hypothetical protein